jgi:GxxExxY protein
VHAAYLIHTGFGPGLLEKVDEICFAHELKKMDLTVKIQMEVPIKYDGLTFEEGSG